MKIAKLSTVIILASAGLLHASTDPFAGTGIYNAEKSPKPTIKYTVKDLGGNRFALTGSTGQTTTIKADGVSIPSPYGGTVSFKKLDDHTWRMNRNDQEELVRTFTVSTDDNTLTLDDLYTRPNGDKHKTVTTYARLSPGNGLLGEWQSVSMTEESSGRPAEFTIEPYGKDGLSFIWPASKHRLDMNFDGKKYYDQGPQVQKGTATSGQRINAHLLQMDDNINNEPDGKEEWIVSDDGKVLTETFRPAKSSAVFTSVFDRKQAVK